MEKSNDDVILFGSSWGEQEQEQVAIVKKSAQWYKHHADVILKADTLMKVYHAQPKTNINTIALDNLTDAIQVVTQYHMVKGELKNHDDARMLDKAYESAVKFITRRHEHIVNAGLVGGCHHG